MQYFVLSLFDERHVNIETQFMLSEYFSVSIFVPVQC
jgi:hypothetical protein